MNVVDLGIIDFEQAYGIQSSIVDKIRKDEAEDVFIICEHKPVITLGRSAKQSNIIVDAEILNKKGVKVININRGGDVTFHGPGQIVVYPLIDLKKIRKDVHFYLFLIEKFIVRFLLNFGLQGEPHIYGTGVWVNQGKIASLGIGVRHWVTYHGFSLNVEDIDGFSFINPCGMRGLKITSIEKELKKHIAICEVKSRLSKEIICFFEEVKNGKNYSA
jgi:lipoate-protein ligase B